MVMGASLGSPRRSSTPVPHEIRAPKEEEERLFPANMGDLRYDGLEKPDALVESLRALSAVVDRTLTFRQRAAVAASFRALAAGNEGRGLLARKLAVGR
jgi:hypothetical protein